MCALPGFCWRILPRAISRGSLVTVQSIKESDGRYFLVNSSVLWKEHLPARDIFQRRFLRVINYPEWNSAREGRKSKTEDNTYGTTRYHISFLYKDGKEFRSRRVLWNATNPPRSIIFVMYNIRSGLITRHWLWFTNFRERFDRGQRPDHAGPPYYWLLSFPRQEKSVGIICASNENYKFSKFCMLFKKINNNYIAYNRVFAYVCI